MEEKIREILRNSGIFKTPIEKIGLETELDRLGVTSISFIKLVVAIETEFNIEFEEENLDFSRLKTLKDIIEYVEKKVNES